MNWMNGDFWLEYNGGAYESKVAWDCECNDLYVIVAILKFILEWNGEPVQTIEERRSQLKFSAIDRYFLEEVTKKMYTRVKVTWGINNNWNSLISLHPFSISLHPIFYRYMGNIPSPYGYTPHFHIVTLQLISLHPISISLHLFSISFNLCPISLSFPHENQRRQWGQRPEGHLHPDFLKCQCIDEIEEMDSRKIR